MSARDTICALASGQVPSAIALVRVSGPAAVEIASRCLNKTLKPRAATLCRLIGTNKEQIDEVVAVFYAAPASFTGEDVLELMLHGGRAVVEAALDAICEVDGVRLADAGEFTRRAVEAGKFDLIEAEAVADLVEADTAAQRTQALRQLNGVTSDQMDRWRQMLLEALALIEVTVDFPDEEDAPDFTTAPVKARLDSLQAELSVALGDDNVGERIRDGFQVALVGAPNVGKSSLLNRLAGRDAAIVTDVAGTTRDIIEVRLNLAGYLVILSDTAGLRETQDLIEQEGVRRARDIAASADVVIHVRDGTLPEGDDALDGATRIIDVSNKSDLVSSPQNVSRETLHLSAKTGNGIDDLLRVLEQELADLVAKTPSPLITRRRHRLALQAATSEIESAIEGLDGGLGSELVAEHVRQAAGELSQLLGVIGIEDVLGEIFSAFCIGK
ncbi:MAG: tRNA uridine-5-carboxymethylaminomethyl(34) synthesis GTPase MnmE [Pseudomonadota bacterium]